MKKQIFFILMLMMLTPILCVRAQMQVHLINVGQGCATLIEFPCGAILIDAGGETNSLFNSTDALKTYLDDFFDRRTDLDHTLQCVYLTHPHKDHTLGVPVLLQPPYKVKNAVTDGLEEGSGKTGQIQLHRAAQAAESTPDVNDDIGFEVVTTEEIGNTGLTNAIIDPVNCQGTNPVIKVLWGASVNNPGWSNTTFNNENNHSLVIRIEYGTSSMLITGDLEETALKNLMLKYDSTALLDADVYLVGHHCSKNGTTQELLDKITPQMALIGVGDKSRMVSWTAWAYGHPNKGILEMLQDKLTATRTPIHIEAGKGAKKFVGYTVSKAIYATAWDDNVVLEANATGQWKKVETTIVPDLVNLNTASISDLEKLPGIGTTKAQAIIDFKAIHGNFNNVDELDNVPGIGPATINLLRPYVKI